MARDFNSISKHLGSLENHDSLSRIMSLKQILTVNLIIKFQFVYRHQISEILVLRVVKKELDVSRIFVVGVEDSRENTL